MLTTKFLAIGKKALSFSSHRRHVAYSLDVEKVIDNKQQGEYEQQSSVNDEKHFIVHSDFQLQ